MDGHWYDRPLDIMFNYKGYNIKIDHNRGKNGRICLWLNYIPSVQERNLLKSYKFRWNPKGKDWHCALGNGIDNCKELIDKLLEH